MKISGGSRAAIRLWDTSASGCARPSAALVETLTSRAASSTDLARALLPSMHTAIFVFDCTSVASFDQLKTWITLVVCLPLLRLPRRPLAQHVTSHSDRLHAHAHLAFRFADSAMTDAAMKNRIVVCTKTDLRVKKAVDRQSAKEFCRRVGCTYFEQCSNSSEGRDKLLQVFRAHASTAVGPARLCSTTCSRSYPSRFNYDNDANQHFCSHQCADTWFFS